MPSTKNKPHVTFCSDNVRNAAWSGVARAFNYEHYNIKVRTPEEFIVKNKQTGESFKITVENLNTGHAE